MTSYSLAVTFACRISYYIEVVRLKTIGKPRNQKVAINRINILERAMIPY